MTDTMIEDKVSKADEWTERIDTQQRSGGALALADGFTFTIGSPVASQDFQAKSAAFVFRTERCAEPAKSQVDATAEGFVKGARRSVPLKVVAMSNGSTHSGLETMHLTMAIGAVRNLTMIISSPDHLGR